MKLPKAPSRQAGQSSQEYGLAIALVGVALLAVFSLFGGNLSRTVSSMANDMQSSPIQAVAPDAIQGNPANTILTSNIQTPTGLEHSFGNADAFSSSVAHTIETSGANGTTEELLAVLESNIPALLAKKTITEEQANGLVKLANLGHQMADIEAMIENAVTGSKKDAKALKKATFIYNNRSYNLSGFLTQIQMATKGSGGNVPLEPNSVVGQFYTLKNSLNQDIKDQKARKLVETLANNIIVIGDSVENFTNDMQSGKTPVPENFKKAMAENTAYGALSVIPSVETHAGSAGICAVNGSSDTGTYCQ